MDVIERFMQKVAIRESGCWEWTAGLCSSGYGVFRLMHPRRMVMAHRFSWEIHHGEIPVGLFALHHCDNRLCVNPDLEQAGKHLFLGTQKDNAQDAKSKGRNTRMLGELNGRSLLTQDDVIAIRSAYAAGGITQAVLAGQYGVTSRAIGFITSGKRWRHVQ